MTSCNPLMNIDGDHDNKTLVLEKNYLKMAGNKRQNIKR